MTEVKMSQIKCLLVLLVTSHYVTTRSLYYSQQTENTFRELTGKIFHHWLSKLQVFSLNGINTNLTSTPNEHRLNDTVPLPTDITEHRLNDIVPLPTDVTPRLNDTIMMLFCENLKYLLPDALFLPPMSILETFPEHTLVYTEIFNANISNMADYKVDHAHVNMPSADQCTLQFQFDYEFIGLQGSYELDVSNPYVHVYGNGPYSIILNGVNISITADFNVENGTLHLCNFDFDFNVTNVQVNISNLYNDQGDLISSFVQNFTIKAIEAFKPDVQEIIRNKTITYGNYMLQYFIMDNLIDFILYIAGV